MVYETPKVMGPRDELTELEAGRGKGEDDGVYAYGFPGLTESMEEMDRDRERRSVFLIHGLLRSEGILN
jgi:hypothetical protein